MRKFTKLTSIALSFICLFSLAPSVMAEDSEIILNEEFEGTSVPEGFYYTEEKGTTLTMVDGQIKYQRPNSINGTGEFWYDLSDLGTLSAQHCNKLIIEYDVAYEVLRNDQYSAFKNTPVILDGTGKKYLDTYIEASTTYSRFVSAQGWTKVPFKIWNASETDTDVYYKTRITIDIANSKQTLEIAEMELGTTAEPVYQSFGTKGFYEAVDGTLGKIDFIISPAWRNATISIDNFKITRAELWADMELVSVTPENGSEFKSNKPEMTVEFTNVVDKETLSSIVLTDEDGDAVETEITVSGNKVTVVPSGYLSYGTEYTLEIGDGIKDSVGQSLLEGAVYSYRTMSDPTDRKGTIYERDTFDSAETIDEYSWTDDGKTTAVIENGLLKYKRSLVQLTGYIDRKLDIQKDTSDIIVFEYDLYPIDKRHDKTSTYEFEFPAVLDDAGKKYCDFYIQPVSSGSTVCKLIKRSGGVLDSEFKLGTDYMYHITLVLDMVNKKYTSVYEEIGLTDGSSRTINCPWTSFYESVNGNISAFRFAGGHEWGSAQLNFDNFICYSPEAVEFDDENSNISDGCEIPARSKLNLSFTNSLAADSEKAVTVFDEAGNAVEIISTLTNGGKTIEIEAADGRFEYNSQYSLELDGSLVTDIFGNVFSDDLQMSFNTTGIPPAKIKFNSNPEYKMLDEQGEETDDITLAKKIQAKEIQKVLKIVRMEGAASNKFKNCSLGMKQRIGIAMALLGNPKLLVLDEPINGLDADGMRIMREILVDITQNYGCTVVISSHILGELEKIATHYGIVRGGKMIKEMTAEELDASCRTYVALQTKDINRTKALLACKYSRVGKDESGYIRVYDAQSPEEIVTYLYANNILISEIKTAKIGLEEYYIDLMNEKEVR